MAEQLKFFDAYLGVVRDHSKDTAPIGMTELGSGEEIELTNAEARFKGPRVISQTQAGDKTNVQMAFNSRKEMNDWIAAQEANGNDLQIMAPPKWESYHPGPVHKQLKFGGTEEGMRAVGYIAQTFLAHSFPDTARRAELKAFKDYTLDNVGSGFVWWDFEPPNDLPPNKFEFGHRIVVGLNMDDGTAYARISFFSTLHFAMLFGTVPVTASRSVITDINPLAKSPPKDIETWSEDAAKCPVAKPDALTAGLSEAIKSGKAEACLKDLVRRMIEFERRAAAQKILDQVAGAAALPDTERSKLFADIVAQDRQRVLNLIRTLAVKCRQEANNPVLLKFADFLDESCEADPTAPSGLTQAATAALDTACDALAKQMHTDFKAGCLDLDRVELLIGDGAGMGVAGSALQAKFVERFPP
jgi:hypothetical protein